MWRYMWVNGVWCYLQLLGHICGSSIWSGWPFLLHCSCNNVMTGAPWNNKLEKLGYLSFTQHLTAWSFYGNRSLARLAMFVAVSLRKSRYISFVTPIKWIIDDKNSEVWRGQLRAVHGSILTGFLFCFWLNMNSTSRPGYCQTYDIWPNNEGKN